MLKDEEILPICRMWARRFLHQAKHLGRDQQDIYNELVDVGYAASKLLSSLEGASTWIMWVLVRYVKIPPEVRVDQRLHMRATEASPCEICQRREEQNRLLHAVSSLTDDERAVIYKYYRDDLTLKQIGDQYDRSTTWVMNRIKAILDKLRKLIGE